MNVDIYSRTFDKVTIFVLRNRGWCLEILTFLHPLAGRQIPAGSVEHKELPVEAAHREVAEETGVYTFGDMIEINEWTEILEDEAVALSDTVIKDELGHEVDYIKRGHRVKIKRIDGSCALLHRIIYDFNVEPPIQLPVDTGWAEICNFGGKIHRYFFLSVVENDGRMSWQQHADGHDFNVEWQPLNQSLKLVSGQNKWLTTHLGELKAYFEKSLL